MIPLAICTTPNAYYHCISESEENLLTTYKRNDFFCPNIERKLLIESKRIIFFNHVGSGKNSPYFGGNLNSISADNLFFIPNHFRHSALVGNKGDTSIINAFCQSNAK